MKQKLSLYNMIIILLEIICLFIPCCFKTEVWNLRRDGRGFSLSYTTPSNIFGYQHQNSLGVMLAIVWISLLLISFIAFMQVYNRKENSLAKYSFSTTVASFISLLIFAIYVVTSATHKFPKALWYWKLDWLFYVIAIMNIVTLILAYQIKNTKYDPEPAQVDNQASTKPNNEANIPEELKKYKELLDSGVITQEEFDAKKKQLLGL